MPRTPAAVPLAAPGARARRTHRARRAPVLAAAALATAVTVAVAVAPAAVAASGASSAASAPATPKLPAGLFGTADPTYDGVFRQATAILALSAAGVTPPQKAVTWLVGQQCADGGFGAYRADPATPCAPKSEDTNSTGMALQALASFSADAPVMAKADAWLAKARNSDGGWGYQPGSGSDPDSTAVVAGALRATGKPAGTPSAALAKLQLGCRAKAADRGAFAFQPGKYGGLVANDKATTDAILALRSSGYLVGKPAADRKAAPLVCPPGGHFDANTAASAAAAYLTADLAAHGGRITATAPGASKPAADPGTTTYAVIALASDGQVAAARDTYGWLRGNGTAWAASSPAGLGALILASHAAGENPRTFGKADLVTMLAKLGPAGTTTSLVVTRDTKPAKKSSSSAAWWIVGVCLVAGIGGGLLLSTRKRNRA